MCHVPKDTTFSASAVNADLLLTISKPKIRLSPFRKIAKSARVNLNRYWGLLSQKENRRGSVSSSVSSTMSMDFSAEEEQNRINELLEARVNAEEQNSINLQIEYDSSPEPPRRLFARQKAIPSSSYSSFSSSSSSMSSSTFPSDFEDSISQDSVFL